MKTILFVVILLQLTANAVAQNEDHKIAGAEHSSVAQLVDDARGSDGIKKSAALQRLQTTPPVSRDEVQRLAELIRSDPEAKEAAAESLGHIPSNSADLKVPVTSLLDDKDAKVQWAAVHALRSMKATETTPRLRKMLSGGPRFQMTQQNPGSMPPPDTRELHMELASTLVEFKDVEAMDEILSRDELMSFGGFGGPLVAKYGAQVLPKAVALAKKRDIRKAGALQAISWMRDEAAVPQLAQLVEDQDAEVASAATSALGKIAPKVTSTNRKIIEDAFDKAVKSKETYVRMNAYEAQIENRDASAFPLTLEMILRENGNVRLSIFYGLMNSNRKEAVPALKEFIKKDEVAQPNSTTERRTAAQAIFRLAGERVPYRGVENDRQLYKDPYDPNPHPKK